MHGDRGGILSTTEDTKRPGRRQQDPEGTRRNIIEVASNEFALNGLAGARIDEIAEKTRASKRMIYYYFGDKEGLYVSALENAYRVVREGEAELDIESLPPLEGLRRLVGFTFDHHSEHERIGSIYTKGVAEGVFRDGLDPLEIHWQISALCFFNVSNRATFSHLFGRDMGSAQNQATLRQNAIDMVFRYLAKPEYI